MAATRTSTSPLRRHSRRRRWPRQHEARVLVEEARNRVQELLDWGHRLDPRARRTCSLRAKARIRNRSCTPTATHWREIPSPTPACAQIPTIRLMEWTTGIDLIVAGRPAAGRVMALRCSTRRRHPLHPRARHAARVASGPGLLRHHQPAVRHRRRSPMAIMPRRHLRHDSTSFHPTDVLATRSPALLLSRPSAAKARTSSTQ